MTDSTAEPAEELLPRLGLIEDQPLAQRAAAYAQLHDQLAQALEGGEQRQR
ncbi:MAG: hypothetical protein QM635_11710 [Microbacteriaceae bacterium]